MTHRNTQSQFFYVMNNIDYSASWEEIEYELGYTLGDHRFDNKECYAKLKEAIKLNWSILNGFFDNKGEPIQK